MATGTPSPSYQWFKDEFPIVGATGSSYFIGNVQYSDAGKYLVITGNGTTSMFSIDALLVVSPALLSGARWISNQFTVDVMSVSGMLYVLEWKGAVLDANWVQVSETSGNGGMLSLSDSAATGAARFYRVRVVAPAGGTQTAPVITQQPLALAVQIGDVGTLSIAVQSGGHLTYQWMKDSSPIADATNSSYVISNAQLTDAGSYYVMVSNAAGSTTSATAIVTVTSPVYAPDSVIGATLTMTITSSTSSPVGSKTIRTFNSASTYSGTTTSGSAVSGTYTYIGSGNTRTVAATQLTGATPGVVQQIVLEFNSPTSGTFSISRPPSPTVTSSGTFVLAVSPP